MHSEKYLISKIKKQNNRHAAGKIIELYYDEMFAYVYLRTRDRELSLDLTQEIFLLVLRSIHSYDEKKASFRTWLYKIAEHKVTDYYRSKYHHQKLQTDDLRSQEQMEATLYQNGNNYDDFTEEFIQHETIREIMSYVSEWEDSIVHIFLEKNIECKTFAKIAEEMHLSENTVKTKYYRLLQYIRKEFRYER